MTRHSSSRSAQARAAGTVAGAAESRFLQLQQDARTRRRTSHALKQLEVAEGELHRDLRVTSELLHRRATR